MTIKGRKKYRLYSFTGRVNGLGKDFIVYTFIQNAKEYVVPGNKWLPPVRVETATNSFDYVFLTDNNGVDHPLYLGGLNIACREGHELIVIWAVREGEERGPYLAVKNYTTGQVFFGEGLLKKLLAIPRVLDPAAALIVFIPLLIFSKWAIAVGTGTTALVVMNALRSHLLTQRVSWFKMQFNFDNV